jgi:hypothetical protein
MKTRILLMTAWTFLTLTTFALAADKTNVVKFYQSYLTLVSASDYVSTSRDDPDGWQQKFDGIAQNVGFEDAADAMAAGEAMGADSDVATLRQAVADKIVQQYQPYRE